MTGKFPPGQFPPDSSPPGQYPLADSSPSGSSLPDNSLPEKNTTRTLPPLIQFLLGHYNTDGHFKLLIKSFCVLAFFLISGAIRAFENLVECNEILSTFVSFFEFIYNGILIGKGKIDNKEVLF